ncbi:MAG: hypothetical protein ACI89T_002255 [Cognaticolwellia sp.]|jgi:hypothetical protein
MMQFTELTEKINTIFNPQALFTAARKTQFLKRARQIVPLECLLAAIPDLAAVHTEIFYNSDFMVDNHVFQQIPLPLYFLSGRGHATQLSVLLC